MPEIDIDKIAEFHRQIGVVLLQDWDPIGVAAIKTAQDEYDGYVREVWDIAVGTGSAEAVAKHLAKIERESMGLFGFRRAKRLLPVAQKIITLATQH